MTTSVTRHVEMMTAHRRTGLVILAMAGLLAITACATPPPRHDLPPQAGPRPPLPSPHVEFSPAKGQTPAQQERDRYECYLWAVRKTGFDPSRPQNVPATPYDEERLANRILHFRRATTACLTGRHYSIR